MQVIAIISEQLGIDEDVITPDASLVDDLGADELDMVELFMAMEDEFEIEIPEEPVKGVVTVRGLVHAVMSQLL
nr:acyl carrier protein [Streptomyces xantholiticus]